MKSLKLLLMLLDDVKQQYPEHKTSIDRDVITINRRHQNEGLSFLAKTLPILGDAIFRGVETGLFICPTSFSRKRKTEALPKFLGGLLEEVFDRRSGSFLEQKSNLTEYLTILRQICYLFKKCSSNGRDEVTLDRKAKLSFVEHDNIQQCETADISTLQKISRFLWNPIDLDDLRSMKPRNGPGGVAESLRANQKYRHIYDHLDRDDASRFDWSFFELHSTEETSSTKTERVSKLISVPKTSTSRRTITIEPCLNMLFQQALNGMIRDRFRNDRYLSLSLSLDDQSASQEMALSSSYTRSFATVDLSAASDRLSLSLVSNVFAHDKLLLDELLAHRTTHVSIDKKLLRLKKYAGMGNATTFPVQSFVFLVLSVQALHIAWDKPPTRNSCRKALSLIRVYGDDIILPSTAYRALCRILAQHGLKVNELKSFVDSRFRESCGCDAYNGVEITPIYVRKQVNDLRDPSTLASLVATANQLFLKCYYRAANYLKDEIELAVGKLPLVSQTSNGLGWYTRYNAYECGRWNQKFHRYDIRTICLRERKQDDALDGYPALLKYFLEAKSPLRDFQRSVRRFFVSYAWRWIAA